MQLKNQINQIYKSYSPSSFLDKYKCNIHLKEWITFSRKQKGHFQQNEPINQINVKPHMFSYAS